MTTRKRPALPDRPLRDTTSAAKSNGRRRQDGYAAPSADECGRWLAAHESVRLHLGPVCRVKAVVA
jgi:hypothetical protein